MYKELTIKNIKTFEEEQKLKIAPITLLYGENSSGKTTLLKTFDIVHNIFAEYQVRSGKNVSEKKSNNLHVNENVQNISAKKIHYFSTKLNKKPLKIEIKLDVGYHKNFKEILSLFPQSKIKDVYQIIRWKNGKFIRPQLRSKYRKIKEISVPLKISLIIKYFPKKKISKIDKIEIKDVNNRNYISFSRVDKKYQKISDKKLVGYTEKREKYGFYNLGTRHRLQAKQDYFVDNELYSDYKINIDNNDYWNRYYTSYKNIFNDNSKIKERLNKIKVLLKYLAKIKYNLKVGDAYKYISYYLARCVLNNQYPDFKKLKNISSTEEKIKFILSKVKNKNFNLHMSKIYLEDYQKYNEHTVGRFDEKKDELIKSKNPNWSFVSNVRFLLEIAYSGHTNLYLVKNFIEQKKLMSFTRFCKVVNSDSQLFKVRFSKKYALVDTDIIRDNGRHSDMSSDFFRKLCGYIDKGSSKLYVKLKSQSSNGLHPRNLNFGEDLLRRCMLEIRSTVRELVICHPNKSDIPFHVPDEADFPDDFIKNLSKNSSIVNPRLAEQDDMVRRGWTSPHRGNFSYGSAMERGRGMPIHADKIRSDGRNFDIAIFNDKKLRKELNKVLKDVFKLEVLVVTPKFLKKILKDKDLYRAYRDAQRRSSLYQVGSGMYSKNKFIMIKDLNYKKSFRIHGDEIGKGPSNILPFLTQLLSKKPNLTYLIQELENNWHPKYQSKIIDLIARIMKKSQKRNFILETHSELFILQVQKLVQKGFLKPSEVSINYISRNEKGSSVVHNIPLNTRGGFEKKWPGGFFTERMEVLTS
jgi:predicted ATPase